MKQDFKIIRQRLKEAQKLPESNPTEYNHKKDLIRHWELERYMLKRAIELDQFQLQRTRSSVR